MTKAAQTSRTGKLPHRRPLNRYLLLAPRRILPVIPSAGVQK